VFVSQCLPGDGFSGAARTPVNILSQWDVGEAHLMSDQIYYNGKRAEDLAGDGEQCPEQLSSDLSEE
jgi:hypothetical protein